MPSFQLINVSGACDDGGYWAPVHHFSSAEVHLEHKQLAMTLLISHLGYESSTLSRNKAEVGALSHSQPYSSESVNYWKYCKL